MTNDSYTTDSRVYQLQARIQVTGHRLSNERERTVVAGMLLLKFSSFPIFMGVVWRSG